MAEPVFRNPDKYKVIQYRDWIRKRMPEGSDGFVSEDIDLVIRWYGEKYQTDAIGSFMLIETKFRDASLNIAQEKTFGLIDRILHEGDPERKRYLGFYVVNYSCETWDNSQFKINGVQVVRQDFYDFLERKKIFPCYFCVSP